MKSLQFWLLTSLIIAPVFSFADEETFEQALDNDDEQQIQKHEKYLPLHDIIKNPDFTIEDKQKELRRILEQKNVDINAQDADGRTALNLVTFYQSDPSLAEILIEFGANVNIPDIFNQMPLHPAVAKNNIEVIELLVQAGAETRFKNDEGLTPLDLARTDEAQSALGLEDEQGQESE